MNIHSIEATDPEKPKPNRPRHPVENPDKPLPPPRKIPEKPKREEVPLKNPMEVPPSETVEVPVRDPKPDGQPKKIKMSC